MENSLSLSACREQNTDSWKPGLDFSLLIQHIRFGDCERLLVILTAVFCALSAVCLCRLRLTSRTAHSPTVCSSRRPESGALSALLPTPPLHSPDPSCRWRGCCSDRSSAGPVGMTGREDTTTEEAALYMHESVANHLMKPVSLMRLLLITSTIPTCRVTSGRVECRSYEVRAFPHIASCS